jgi:hypothetical protein
VEEQTVFHRHPWLLAVAAALAVTVAARAETKPEAADVKALADRIDRRIEAGWKAHQVKPAQPADDAAFLRRVYLDLVGQVPALSEVRDFLDDPAADKRTRLVERLLTTDAHVRFFAATWRKIMVPPDAQLARGPGLELWLQQQIRDNVGYDKVAREILAGPTNAVPFQEFSLANGNRPENLGAAASRVFLGVRIECAQCHNHPFAKWKKQQFWEFAAFFNRGPLAIPDTDKKVNARLLVGDTPELKPEVDPRTVLADWVTRADNPFFAQAAVNRLWLHFFGIGLVDPVDGLGENLAPPSHPELLDELAKEFAAHRFDLRFLLRAITGSKTYMLSSVVSDESQNDPRQFARAAVRGLTPEQLYDSLAVVTGKVRPLARGSGETIPNDTFGRRAEFVARFTTPGTPLDAEASILQALHLMNGKPMADVTSLDGNRLLRTVAEAESLTTARRIEELYLLTMARKPRPEESARLVKYVDSGGPRGDKKKALADVYWALLNSSEFGLNH